MKADLRISIIQTDLLWHQPQANRDRFAEKISDLSGKTDLILLPEMFTSGFTNEIDGLLNEVSPTSDWMLDKAQLSGAAICGSTVFDTGKSGYTNRMLFATPEGQLYYYDKVHLFRMAGEHKRYEGGEQRVIVQYRDWNILLLVCYDLRFPVFCRNRQDYELALCVANWPAARREPWRKLLEVRALENLSYYAGVNRVGIDGNGVSYSGDSMFVDFKGNAVIDHPRDDVFIDTGLASVKALLSFREKFQAWRDADDFDIKGISNRYL